MISPSGGGRVTGLRELDYYPGIGIDCQDRAVPDPAVMKLQRTFPARCRAALLLALCVLLLGGCWNGRVLFSFERPFWSSWATATRLQTALAGEAVRRGYMPRFEIGAGAVDPLKTLQATAASGRYSVVVVGPLLSFDWAGYVPAVPRTRFILVDAPVTDAGPAGERGVPHLRQDCRVPRGRPGRRRVRARAAWFSGFGRRRVRSWVRGSRSCGVTMSGLAGAETDAFTHGAAERPGRQHAGDATAFPAARTGPPSGPRSNRCAARGRWSSSSVSGSTTRRRWKRCVTTAAWPSLSDWQASGAFPDQVLASVEEDMPGGITRALDALRSGTARVGRAGQARDRKKI